MTRRCEMWLAGRQCEREHRHHGPCAAGPFRRWLMGHPDSCAPCMAESDAEVARLEEGGPLRPGQRVAADLGEGFR